jgi:hypothetical protein
VWSDLNEAWEVTRIDVVREVLRRLAMSDRARAAEETAVDFGLGVAEARVLREFVAALLARNSVSALP